MTADEVRLELAQGELAAAYEMATRITAERDEARADAARLRAAGNDLAHWLQVWIDDSPEHFWCYSEAALAAWRALSDGQGVGDR